MTISPNYAFTIEPDVFVQSTVNRASQALSKNISKEAKIEELKIIAKETVDIKGVGFYSLGSVRKNLNDLGQKSYQIGNLVSDKIIDLELGITTLRAVESRVAKSMSFSNFDDLVSRLNKEVFPTLVYPTKVTKGSCKAALDDLCKSCVFSKTFILAFMFFILSFNCLLSASI